MTYSVTKAGPYFASGEIKFSALRDTFRRFGTMISASELRRNTTVTREQTDPVVPDATENTNISSGSNLALSQFRNSIKYYDITQSDTNENVSINSLSWNSNLNKSIRKVLNITGTIGATSTSVNALSLTTDAYNLNLNISGSILAAGGSGGSGGSAGFQQCGVHPGSNAGGGGGGGAAGNAVSISSNGRVVINIGGSGKVYSGGAGGSGGSGGRNGADSTCSYYTYYYTGYACGSVPGCGGNTAISSQGGGGCNCVTTTRKKVTTTICYNTYYRTYCRATINYQVCGGAGGAGGSGGAGQGYNNPGGPGSGGGGSAGQSRSCPNPSVGFAAGGVGNTGGTGNSGSSGGSWGQGRAIFGSLFTVTGSTGSENIKGTFS